MQGPVLLFLTNQSYEHAISRMKRGGGELIVAVVSFWHHCCDQYLHHWNTNVDSLTFPVPLHQMFHPWSNRDAPENILRIAQSFLFTQARGVSTICCWASSRQFTLCGTFSDSLLSRVCSSRAVGVHCASLACMTIQRGAPSAGAMIKSQFWHPVCWFFTRYKGTPSAT